MPHDLIDNQNIKLVDIIKQTLPGSAGRAFCRRLLHSLQPGGRSRWTQALVSGINAKKTRLAPLL